MQSENKRTLKVALCSFICTALCGTLLWFMPFPVAILLLAFALASFWNGVLNVVILVINRQVDGSL